MRTEPTSMPTAPVSLPTSPANPDQVAAALPRRAGAAASADRAPAEAARPGAPSAADLRKAVEQANQQLDEKSSELSFQLDDDTGSVVVKLVDTKTKEVLRQIPSPEALAIAKALAEQDKRGALLRADA
jgi:flagellar protein FlaG